MPGARGNVGLAARWCSRGELGATPCPPKISVGLWLLATFCSEVATRVFAGYGGATRLRRAAWAFVAQIGAHFISDFYTGDRVSELKIHLVDFSV